MAVGSGGWSVTLSAFVVFRRELLFFRESVRTVSAATLATVTTFKVERAREHHQAVLEIKVNAFDERLWHN